MVQGQQQEPWDGKRPQPCATTPQLQSREVACAHSALPAEKVPLAIGSAAFFWRRLNANRWKLLCSMSPASCLTTERCRHAEPLDIYFLSIHNFCRHSRSPVPRRCSRSPTGSSGRRRGSSASPSPPLSPSRSPVLRRSRDASRSASPMLRRSPDIPDSPGHSGGTNADEPADLPPTTDTAVVV